MYGLGISPRPQLHDSSETSSTPPLFLPFPKYPSLSNLSQTRVLLQTQSPLVFTIPSPMLFWPHFQAHKGLRNWTLGFSKWGRERRLFASARGFVAKGSCVSENFGIGGVFHVRCSHWLSLFFKQFSRNWGSILPYGKWVLFFSFWNQIIVLNFPFFAQVWYFLLHGFCIKFCTSIFFFWSSWNR